MNSFGGRRAKIDILQRSIALPFRIAEARFAILFQRFMENEEESSFPF
jgi:hypothetical protein